MLRLIKLSKGVKGVVNGKIKQMNFGQIKRDDISHSLEIYCCEFKGKRIEDGW